MFEWSLENLIRTCTYLAYFFTVVWLAKFFIFSAKILHLQAKKQQTEPSFLFEEIYTFQSVSAFFTGFGWLGIYLLKQPHGASVTYCMISSVIAGFICMLISAKMMYLMKKDLFRKTEEEKIEPKAAAEEDEIQKETEKPDSAENDKVSEEKHEEKKEE